MGRLAVSLRVQQCVYACIYLLCCAWRRCEGMLVGVANGGQGRVRGRGVREGVGGGEKAAWRGGMWGKEIGLLMPPTRILGGVLATALGVLLALSVPQALKSSSRMAPAPRPNRCFIRCMVSFPPS